MINNKIIDHVVLITMNIEPVQLSLSLTNLATIQHLANYIY